MKIWNVYNDFFDKYEKEKKLIRPFIPKDCKHNAHMYYVILPTEEKRDELISYLKENGISASFHYVPLHTSPVGKKYGYKIGDLPITEEYSSRLIRLPLYADMSKDDLDYILDVLRKKLEV